MAKAKAKEMQAKAKMLAKEVTTEKARFRCIITLLDTEAGVRIMATKEKIVGREVPTLGTGMETATMGQRPRT